MGAGERQEGGRGRGIAWDCVRLRVEKAREKSEGAARGEELRVMVRVCASGGARRRRAREREEARQWKRERDRL